MWSPTPIWKSSYRLVFDEQAKPLLEGWAIVDNTTGEDWTGVTLSLVSGMPVSFISPLYEPRYVSRPVVELPGDRAQRPILHGGVVEQDAAANETLAFAAPPAPAAPGGDRRAYWGTAGESRPGRWPRTWLLRI